MKFSLSWLHRHLETTLSAEKLADAMTRLGIEVESLENPGEALRNFTVARIEAIEPHPNADRLRICRVNDGTAVHQVVCGAPNARADIHVVLALPGVVIPATGNILKPSKIRGVESFGMMCSEKELGLSEESEGIKELSSDIPLGVCVAELYSDPIFDINVTPNRADCFGVRGIARDLAAVQLGTLKPLYVSTLPTQKAFPYAIKYQETSVQTICPFFSAIEIRGVRNAPSPLWLQGLLKKAGLNPISALVDVTNFFTLDRCRPLHCYDVDQFVGTPCLRLANEGEKFTDLKGHTHTLSSSMALFADKAGPLGLLGIMGGERGSSSFETTTILLEAAWFKPESIARTGQALCLTSDARTRFERGVEYTATVEDLCAAAAMIIELCGGEASVPFLLGTLPEKRAAIYLNPCRIEQLAGTPVTEAACILQNLGCAEDSAHHFTPPPWRHDLAIAEDLVEDVLRVYGYDKVMPCPLQAPKRTYATHLQSYKAEDLKRHLAGRGMTELISYTFIRRSWAGLFEGAEAKLIELCNPISTDLAIMRPSILPNLLEAVMKNSRRENAPFALFELGPMFDQRFTAYERPAMAGIRSGYYAAHHWSKRVRPVDLFDAKADVLALLGDRCEKLNLRQEAPKWMHPGCSGTFFNKDKPVAVFGMVHPEVLKAFDLENVPVVGFELFLDTLGSEILSLKRAPELKAFQQVTRDFAFIVNKELSAGDVIACVRQAGKRFVSRINIFDVYTGAPLADDKKSIGISVTFLPDTATFSEEDLQKFSDRIVRTVSTRIGGVLR
jgi:phenylalanyl-tRNA synthetase beta chain